jgi:pyruvate,water dikinase
MSWQPLARFCDSAIPKLDNLRRAAAAGLRVPLTVWLPAVEIARSLPLPPESIACPLILRSASPTEDGHTTSNAGQLLSLIVRQPDEFADALRRVVEALPRVEGRALGAVFAQPLVEGKEAGVAFFDGFYYERTVASAPPHPGPLPKEGEGGAGQNRALASPLPVWERGLGGEGALNTALTAGQARGAVTRGHLERDDEWSAWLASVYAVFGKPRGDPRLDIEFARDGRGPVLLQVRPALFPLLRNPLLTQTNLIETLGEMPSPWTVSSLVEAGRDMSFLARIEPDILTWGESFFEEVADRPWVNLSFWYRWLDRLGMSRTFATLTLGGVPTSAADARWALDRFLPVLPRLLAHLPSLWHKAWFAERALKELDVEIEAAEGLSGLYRAGLRCWVLGLETAMSIIGVSALISRLRLALGLAGSARLVTHDLMEEYRELLQRGSPEERVKGLDAWLERYGHRGPLESDVARPRFLELREALRQDLLRAPPAPIPPAPAPSLWSAVGRWLFRPLNWFEERREWFRDAATRRTQRMRARLLEEGARLTAAGLLDAPDDVFWLRGQDLKDERGLRQAVAEAKARREAVRRAKLPLTARLSEIESALAATGLGAPDEKNGQRAFTGIALGPKEFVGRVVKADDLMGLLRSAAADSSLLGPDTVLVVPALEPSWAVVFGRIGAVVAEVGGELSHASILLREAGRPALVNVTGIFAQVETGDRVRLDGRRGTVELLP